MISPRRIFAVFLRQYYETTHSFDRLMDGFFWPVLDITTWGLLTFYVESTSSLNLAHVVLGAIIFWTMTYSIQRDMTMVFMQDVWDRNLYNVIASPIRPTELILGGILFALARLGLLVGLMTALAAALYHFSFLSLAPLFIGAFFIIVSFGISAGILLSGVLYRFGSTVQILIWSGLAMLAPFIAITYPVAVLPERLQTISWALPPTYVFEFVRHYVTTNELPTMAQWLTPIALSSLFFALSIAVFAYGYRHAKRRGWFIKMD